MGLLNFGAMVVCVRTGWGARGMREKGCEVKAVDKADQPNGSSIEERGQWLEFPEGMLSYCTWAQDAASTKTQKENRLVSGLTDHRYLSVTRARHRGACQWAGHQHAKQWVAAVR